MSLRRRVKTRPSTEGKLLASQNDKKPLSQETSSASQEGKCMAGQIERKLSYRHLRFSNSSALKRIGSSHSKCIEIKKKYIIGTGMSQTAHGVSNSEQIVMFQLTGRDVNIVNYKTGEVQGLKADCYIMECLTVSPSRFIVASPKRLKSKSYFLHLLDHNFKTIHKIPSPNDGAALCCLRENEFLVYSDKDTSYDVFYIYQIKDDKIKLKDSVQVTGLPVPDMTKEIRLGMSFNSTNGNVTLSYKSYEYDDEDKWFQCYTVDLNSGYVTKYTGDEPVYCQYIDDNGDLLVCTDDDVLRVYRDIDRGIREYEELIHVNAEDFMVGIARHGDSLILGYEDRVDYYSLR